MEWETCGSWIDLFWNSEKITGHSTPLSKRPAPTLSPNLSKILYAEDDTKEDEELMELVEHMAQLKLD